MTLLDILAAAMVRGYTVGAKREADHVFVDALHLQASLKSLEEAIMDRTTKKTPHFQMLAKEETNGKE